MADFYHCLLLHLLSILALLEYFRVECLQCYSCKSTGSNELDANIKCLENAYLENCEEFYDYYNEIEDQDVISYEYYYYDKGNNGHGQTNKDDKNKPPNKVTDNSKNKIEAPLQITNKEEPESLERRQKRAAKDKSDSVNEGKDKNSIKVEEDEYVEYYYDYEYVDDNGTDTESYKFNDQASTTTGSSKKSTNVKEKDKSDTKPTEPQHYCYSQAFKSSWESYTVEKGCKKISYCKNSLEKKPEWAHPWNFCCDKSRCNVKLVKDKPQRVFGMGCRRQDDCIQGHISRTLCPHYFKSCPRISTSMIKMECRVKARTMGTVKNGAKYRHQFREKKCYCAKGYFPRGPICTSGITGVTVHYQILASNIFVAFSFWLLH